MDNKSSEAYSYLFKLRENASSLLHSRMSIMIIIQAAVISFIANTFESLIKTHSPLLIIVEIFGLVSSIFMTYLIQGGMFWLKHWDTELETLEKEALGKYEVFRGHPYINLEKKKRIGKLKSTRTALFLFGFLFVIVWIILILYTILII